MIKAEKYDKVNKIGTILYVVIDNEYCGYIVISDKIKDDSYKMINDLKSHNINKIVMLTGDANSIGKSVCDELNIDEYYAELLPQDKVSITEKLMNEKNGNLLFIGDGINDAPVLALSDIGVSMGSLGSDAAIEASDIVIMTDEPSKIVDAIKISKKTMKIVRENIIFAIGVKITVLILSLDTNGFAASRRSSLSDSLRDDGSPRSCHTLRGLHVFSSTTLVISAYSPSLPETSISHT